MHWEKCSLLSWWLVVVGLVEQKVCSKLLVLVAGEVCLDGLVAVEAEAAELLIQSQLLDPKIESIVRSFHSSKRTYTFNSITLLLGDGNCLCARGEGSVVVTILTQEAEELLGVLCDQLGKLRIAGAKLL